MFLHRAVQPHQTVIAIARDDDTTFGIVSSKLHVTWALRLGSWLGVGNDPRYTPTTTFQTFPFPEGLTPDIPESDYRDDPRAIRISAAAKHLDVLRESWLNPEDLVDSLPEVVPGYPQRLMPKGDPEREALKKRTLTSLYNANPDWLQHAHRDLDEAVAAAYGWTWPLTDDEVLSRLFELNQQRAGRVGSPREDLLEVAEVGEI